MTFFETYGKELVALAVPFIAWILNYVFRARARLVLANPHNFTFLVPPVFDAQGNRVPAPGTIQTNSLMLVNAGRETATKVDWVFNWKPMCMNFWPARKYGEHEGPDKRYTVTFDNLAPNEYLGCELLTVGGESPKLLTVRCEQCVASNIAMYPQPVLPAWRRRLRAVLIFAGFALLVYGALLLLQFLVLRTPLGH